MKSSLIFAELLAISFASCTCGGSPGGEGEGEGAIAGEGEGEGAAGEGEGEGTTITSCSDPSAQHCAGATVTNDAGLSASFAGCNVVDGAIDVEGPVTSLAALSDVVCATGVIVTGAQVSSLHGLEQLRTPGGVSLTSDAQLSDISALAAASANISGLELDGLPSLSSLHGLEGAGSSLTGVVLVELPRVTSLAPLAGVQSVHGLTMTNVPVVDFHELTNISFDQATLTLSRMPALTSLAGLSRGSLFGVDIEDCPQLTAIDLTSIATTLPNGLRVTNLPRLQSLLAPSLISSEIIDVEDESSSFTTLDLHALATVQFASRFDTGGLAAVALPALTSTTSIFVTGSGLTSFSADALGALDETDSNVGFGLDIESSPKLASISFASLTSVAPSLVLKDLPALGALGFPALTSMNPSTPVQPPPGSPPGGFMQITNTGIHDLTGLPSLSSPLALQITGDALTSLDNGHISDGSFVTIAGVPSLSSISALSSTNLGFISIGQAPALTTLDGLQGSDNFGVSLSDDAGLTSLAGLDPTTMSSLAIDRCGALTSAAVSHVTSIDQLEMSDDAALTSLSFPLLTSSNAITFARLGLTSLAGLESLASVQFLQLDTCSALTSLAGLSGLRTIQNQLRVITAPAFAAQQSLTSLDGIAPSSIHVVDIENIASLTSLSALSSATIDVVELQSLPALSSLNGLQAAPLATFSVFDAAALTTLDPVAFAPSSTLIEVDQTGLTSLGSAFAAVTSVPTLHIAANASLPECQVDAVVAKLTTPPSDLVTTGNDTTATCP